MCSLWVTRAERVEALRERVGGGRRDTEHGLRKKSIVSCQRQVMRFGVGICFLIVTGAMVRVIIHEAPGRVSKQKREPGESEELFAGTRERGQISNV